MGLFDVLRGQRTPRPADLDALFGIGSAAVTLEASMGLASTGRAGVCFKAVEAGVFDELVRETEELLLATSAEAGTTISRHADEFGFSWIVIHDPDVEDLATTSHVISRSMRFSTGGWVETRLDRENPRDTAGMMKKAFMPSAARRSRVGTRPMVPSIAASAAASCAGAPVMMAAPRSAANSR